jgi:exosortase
LPRTAAEDDCCKERTQGGAAGFPGSTTPEHRVTREGLMTRKPSDLCRSLQLPFLAALAAGVLALVWAYWTTLAEMAQRWARDPQYSHGYLVPGFAVLLLGLRRRQLAGDVRGVWWGWAVLGVGLVLRLVGGFFYFVWLDDISLLPCLAGLVLLFGGRVGWRWAWPAVAFLVFMIPLPHRVSVSMASPLQDFATTTSTFLLQTLGFPALAEGHIIRLNEVEIGIVEACSGLRMLVIFFALSTGAALVIRRPLWEKLVLVFSAVPIALVVNVIRITATGILHETVGSDWANAVFHDLAGWLMMPLALVALGLELHLLKRLFLEPVAGPAVSAVGLRPPSAGRGTPPAPGPRPTRRRAAGVAAWPVRRS